MPEYKNLSQFVEVVWSIVQVQKRSYSVYFLPRMTLVTLRWICSKLAMFFCYSDHTTLAYSKHDCTQVMQSSLINYLTADAAKTSLLGSST